VDRQLRRPLDDRVFAGVCSGIARFFGLDSSVVRLAWLVLTLVGGSGLALYFVAWFAIPDDNEQRTAWPIILAFLPFLLAFLCAMCAAMASVFNRA
jgi:phage shock protein C